MNTTKLIRIYLTNLLIIYTVFSSDHFPQKIHFDRISTSEGLSNNLIFDILQDESGFIWIATDDGLNRYDGNEFKIFRNNPNDKNTISDNSV